MEHWRSSTPIRDASSPGDAFVGVIKREGNLISMDGKGRWVDSVFVARLWRSRKYEGVYLEAYESVAEVRTGIGDCFRYYNRARGH